MPCGFLISRLRISQRAAYRMVSRELLKFAEAGNRGRKFHWGGLNV